MYLGFSPNAIRSLFVQDLGEPSHRLVAGGAWVWVGCLVAPWGAGNSPALFRKPPAGYDHSQKDSKVVVLVAKK